MSNIILIDPKRVKHYFTFPLPPGGTLSVQDIMSAYDQRTGLTSFAISTIDMISGSGNGSFYMGNDRVPPGEYFVYLALQKKK